MKVKMQEKVQYIRTIYKLLGTVRQAEGQSKTVLIVQQKCKMSAISLCYLSATGLKLIRLFYLQPEAEPESDVIMRW